MRGLRPHKNLSDVFSSDWGWADRVESGVDDTRPDRHGPSYYLASKNVIVMLLYVTVEENCSLLVLF